MVKTKIILPKSTLRRDNVWVFDYRHFNYHYYDGEYTHIDTWGMRYLDHARTLDPEYIGRHSDGWHIVGKIKEDYFKWVNDFKATNGKHFVCGNFEKLIYTDSPETLVRFLSTYPYSDWNYGDI